MRDRIKVLKDTGISPSMLADQAIAARLFGDFPTGVLPEAASESLERIERADLMLGARYDFFSPNNATLTIIGGIQTNRAMRALRQLLGVWRKSEQLVTGNFQTARSSGPAHADRKRASRSKC